MGGVGWRRWRRRSRRRRWWVASAGREAGWRAAASARPGKPGGAVRRAALAASVQQPLQRRRQQGSRSPPSSKQRSAGLQKADRVSSGRKQRLRRPQRQPAAPDVERLAAAQQRPVEELVGLGDEPRLPRRASGPSSYGGRGGYSAARVAVGAAAGRVAAAGATSLRHWVRGLFLRAVSPSVRGPSRAKTRPGPRSGYPSRLAASRMTCAAPGSPGRLAAVLRRHGHHVELPRRAIGAAPRGTRTRIADRVARQRPQTVEIQRQFIPSPLLGADISTPRPNSQPPSVLKSTITPMAGEVRPAHEPVRPSREAGGRCRPGGRGGAGLGPVSARIRGADDASPR